MLKKDRKYYRIGQVSEIIGVEPHVLRFWESQFKYIQPRRISKRRLYRSQDIRILKRIKQLLYEEGYTIAGARKKIREEFLRKTMGTKRLENEHVHDMELVHEIKKELLEIKKILSKKTR